MLSVCICSCINRPERGDYLKRCVDSLNDVFSDRGIEILIGFDKYGTEVDGAKCYTHENGMGHSWNWAMENASFEDILQIEDDWIIQIAGPNIENLPEKKDFFHYLDNRISVLNKFGGIFRFTCTDDKFWKPGKTKHTLNGFDFIEANRPDEFRMGTWDMYLYTNQPHMKKKDLHESVGYYKENAPAHEVEIDMCRKFHASGKKVFMNPFFTLIHIGEVQSRVNV